MGLLRRPRGLDTPENWTGPKQQQGMEEIQDQRYHEHNTGEAPTVPGKECQHNDTNGRNGNHEQDSNTKQERRRITSPTGTDTLTDARPCCRIGRVKTGTGGTYPPKGEKRRSKPSKRASKKSYHPPSSSIHQKKKGTRKSAAPPAWKNTPKKTQRFKPSADTTSTLPASTSGWKESQPVLFAGKG